MSLHSLKQHERIKEQVFISVLTMGWDTVWRHTPAWRNWWGLTSVPFEEQALGGHACTREEDDDSHRSHLHAVFISLLWH